MKENPRNDHVTSSEDILRPWTVPETPLSKTINHGLALVNSDESQLVFGDFFNILPAAVYTCEASTGKITFYNKHAVELWGRTPQPNDTDERFCGSFRLWRSDGTPLPHDQTPMAVSLRNGQSFRNEEVVIEQPDGTLINVLANIDPIRDAKTNMVVGAINVFHDITPLKQAEETKALLAAIVESSDDAIVSKSLDGIIQSWNAGAERIFGFAAEEAVGQSIYLIVPPELWDEESLILKRLRQGKRIVSFETVRKTKQGDYINVSLTISPVKNAEGRIMGMSTVARNITTRKRTEEALRAKEAELELITETTPLLLTRCSRDLRFLFANRAAATFLGSTPSEIMGKPIVDVMGEEAFAVIKPHVEQVLRGEPVEFETKVPYPGIGLRWVHVNYLPEKDQDGNVIGWVASIVDIAKRKEAEEALQKLTESLEELVAERTQQVRRLVAELVASEQLVRKRIAYMLHDDLQQLLVAVEIQVELLKTSESEKDKLREVKDIIRQGIRLSRQLSVELSPPILSNEDLYGMLTWLAQHMGDVYSLQVTIETPRPAPAATEDQQVLLYQIVRELLFNVVKHAGVGEAFITLEDETDGYTVTVSDNGQGFDLAKLALNDASHFGLHSINQRLQLVDGRAKVDSHPGEGTRITLFLPYK